jgi:hypothetical protein
VVVDNCKLSLGFGNSAGCQIFLFCIRTALSCTTMYNRRSIIHNTISVFVSKFQQVVTMLSQFYAAIILQTVEISIVDFSCIT